ncbi:SidA/IucD/PvdA family monooxygenase, partial [Streptomyces sp. NPDC048279]|uniref:SidA/IucD/PvdA family monooxygenase n=1 Tax=Streptomyces sp. NPDC048279 TaxID=3154714 RepID=UPI003419243C
MRYGQWFRKRHVGEVEPARVTAVERPAPGAGFVVRSDDGQETAASAVVVATGLNGLAHVPDELRHLTPEGPGLRAPVSHTSHHTDLSACAGRRVAVVGGGRSALESAALCTRRAPRLRCRCVSGRCCGACPRTSPGRGRSGWPNRPRRWARAGSWR